MGKVIQISESKAIAKMKNTKKMAWLIIQSAEGPGDDDGWVNLFPQDVPAWVTEDEVLGKMMDGKMVCADPENHSRWYRAYEVNGPRTH